MDPLASRLGHHPTNWWRWRARCRGTSTGSRSISSRTSRRCSSPSVPRLPHSCVGRRTPQFSGGSTRCSTQGLSLLASSGGTSQLFTLSTLTSSSSRTRSGWGVIGIGLRRPPRRIFRSSRRRCNFAQSVASTTSATRNQYSRHGRGSMSRNVHGGTSSKEVPLSRRNSSKCLKKVLTFLAPRSTRVRGPVKWVNG